ncbi:DNA-binding protein [Mycoplasmatota bacterium]|nr:DNA-binding protein [Mycoplasmatota bacterium]
MDYISVQEAAIKWGISERRIQKLCEENRISGVVRFSRMWLIPKDAKKPVDGRKKTKD